MYGYVYMTTNRVNGKRYIGKKVSKKFEPNYLGSGTYLKNAISKYGSENFSVEVIEECSSRDILCQREMYWISYYNAAESPNFYNMSYGGECGWNYYKFKEHNPFYGKHHTPETRLKLQEHALERHMVGENNPNYGHKWSEEKRHQASELRKGKPRPPEQGLKTSIGLKRRWETHVHHCVGRVWVHNPDTGIRHVIPPEEVENYKSLGYILGPGEKKMGAYTYKPWTEEQKERLRNTIRCKGLNKGEKNPMYGKGDRVSGEKNGMYNKHHTEETKSKISVKNTGREVPIELRERLSSSMMGRIFVNNGEKSIRIFQEELPLYLKSGWNRGRLRKKHEDKKNY